MNSIPIAAGLIPMRAFAAKPCPPPSVGFEGGPTVRTSCGGADADWKNRISGNGVVWHHDFSSASEVNAFRWKGGYRGGNDPRDLGAPGTCIYDPTDGVTGGGCLKVIRGAGTKEGAYWWRPFSPIVGGGNGRGEDDPGAGIAPQAYSATDGGSQIYNWMKGYYGNADYFDEAPGQFDGNEYWLQMRIKMDPTRTDEGMPQVGKLTFQTTTRFSHSPQELVTYSGAFWQIGGKNYHRMYDGYLTNPIEQYDSLGRPGKQVGSDLADYNAGRYCDFDSSRAQYCWAWSGGWDTVMYHIVPGHDSMEDTHLEVYAAHEGETNFTKIWDIIYAAHFNKEPADPPQFQKGWNALICAAYHNGDLGLSLPHQIWHRYDQIIFSKSFIPCPQV